ncbi:MAG: TonB-dependent hemoglobin/transferrin/lactoferrin family receptor [Burkholderiales bacterium]|nr:TonB-dependent hemoglobin/transferrin/lactoferrin family receptor [Burkholderiales bacterium]
MTSLASRATRPPSSPAFRALLYPLFATAAMSLPDAGAQVVAQRLGEITVTSTRTERDVADVPNTVSVISAQDIERGQMQDIADLIRYEPGISVRGDTRRFGNSSFGIRGIDGNRVLIQVDGARIADEFAFGNSQLNGAGRDMVDLDTLKRVEIVRGAASSLYGSDAIGGVVSFLTLDPDDLLRRTGRAAFAGMRSGYASHDRSWTNGFAVAAGREAVQAMLMYNNRGGHETDNRGNLDVQGATRTAANPQSYRIDSVLAKLVLKPAAGQQLRVTFEERHSSTSTNVLSGVPALPRVTDLQGMDTVDRRRVALDHEWRSPTAWIDRLRWQVYSQDSVTLQRSRQVRTNTTAACSGVTAGINRCVLDLDTTFSQRVLGGSFSVEQVFNALGGLHRLTWGGDASRTNTFEQRDGVRVNQTTGATTKTLFPDPAFPVHDFPEADTTLRGLYVQDEAAFMEGRILAVGGLRYDTYRLTPHDDPVFRRNNVANPVNLAAAREVSEAALSPKLGATYKAAEELSVYANYAHGFRAPSALEAQAAFSNPGAGYILAPNGNLKPEKSRGVEVGVRADLGAVNLGLAVFDNRYRDFISQIDICPSHPSCGVGGVANVFQNVNLSNVRIYGVELRGDWKIDRALTARGALGYANGTDRSRNVPINTVDPLKAVAGLRWTPAAHWGGEVTLTHVAAKTRVDDLSNSGFRTPAYQLLDLTGHYALARHASLTFGLFNITNKKYWHWSDVRLLAASTTAAAPLLNTTVATSPLDRYTQPGINASVNLRVNF